MLSSKKSPPHDEKAPHQEKDVAKKIQWKEKVAKDLQTMKKTLMRRKT